MGMTLTGHILFNQKTANATNLDRFGCMEATNAFKSLLSNALTQIVSIYSK